jgi:cellobiose phosphorylase
MQGPFELLYAFGHYALARQVLLRVYAHQSARSGQWPQWFMFDRYPIAADNCHGDVFL